MAGNHSAPKFEQPKEFAFTKENLEQAKAHIAKYPSGRQQSAVMPLLMLAQQQHDGWLPVAAMEVVANMLGMPYIRVYEVASFYTMYNLAPAGKHHVQVCTTTPCWLRGSDEVVRACRDTLGVEFGECTPDGMFKLSEVECLGACVNAPMLQITSGYDDKYFEDLTYASTRELLQNVARGKEVKEGPQSGRTSSEPASGATTLRKKA
jgi:NADH-quinone oxidoreductase E subunit